MQPVKRKGQEDKDRQQEDEGRVQSAIGQEDSKRYDRRIAVGREQENKSINSGIGKRQKSSSR